MPSTRLTLFILASQKDAANQWVRDNIDPHGDTFTSPLTDDGTSITHYWASGLWSDTQLADLQEKFGVNAYEGSPQEALVQKGLSVFTTQI